MSWLDVAADPGGTGQPGGRPVCQPSSLLLAGWFPVGAAVSLSAVLLECGVRLCLAAYVTRVPLVLLCSSCEATPHPSLQSWPLTDGASETRAGWR